MIGLVVVSHSRALADGVAELAGQMAPDVAVVPSGGDGAGGLGTDYPAVAEAVARADSGSGVVVLFDLGSARMVAEMAAEEAAGEVLVVDAPLVEGAVAAAVAAQGGAGLDGVAAAAAAAPVADPGADAAAAAAAAAGAGVAAVGAAAAADATAGTAAAAGADAAAAAGAGVAAVGAAAAADAAAGAGAGAAGRAAGDPSTQDGVREEVLLANEVGLHARPAALLARSLAGLDARVVVRYGGREADAASVLALMGLGAPGGSRVEVVATGPDAAEAVRRVGALAARHFDE